MKMFKISKGNSKLGSVPNINVPAITTCRHDAPCKKECYACKGTFNYKNVKNRYAENLAVFLESPEKAELDLLSQLPYMGFIRLHTSGDFVNMDYLKMIVRICDKLPNVKFMAFTKKYELINEYIELYGELPENLKIIFSLWDGFACDNPHNFPTSAVQLKLGNIDPLPANSFDCPGRCDQCFKCWMLEKGENVLFQQHGN